MLALFSFEMDLHEIEPNMLVLYNDECLKDSTTPKPRLTSNLLRNFILN
jgi:hypothetical protein